MTGEASASAQLRELRVQLGRLHAENARLLRLLELTPAQARPPGPTPTAIYERTPGPVDRSSPPTAKVAFFRSLFRARNDVYARRFENHRGAWWMPVVAGGRSKGIPAAERRYLPVTDQLVHEHLTGKIDLGLYPLIDGDSCYWLAADFDGPAAMLDASAYLKAARAAGAPAALEVSRSGLGAHVWIFFTDPSRPRRPEHWAAGCCAKRSRYAGRWTCPATTGCSPPKTPSAPAGWGT